MQPRTASLWPRSDVTLTPPDPLARALRLYRARKFQDAEAICAAIVKVQIQHFDPVYLLANIQFRLRRPTEALASYEAALALRPEHPGALCNRASPRSSPRRRPARDQVRVLCVQQQL